MIDLYSRYAKKKWCIFSEICERRTWAIMILMMLKSIFGFR